MSYFKSRYVHKQLTLNRVKQQQRLTKGRSTHNIDVGSVRLLLVLSYFTGHAAEFALAADARQQKTRIAHSGAKHENVNEPKIISIRPLVKNKLFMPSTQYYCG